VRALAAALLAGGAAFGVHRVLPPAHPVVIGALVLSVFGAVYLGAALALQIDEARGLVRRFTRR
jgi:hypothetical protein